MSKNYVIALKESLQKKLDVLEEIYRISLQQSDILAKDPVDYEAFDIRVDDKDVCIQKLSELDEGFELVYSRVADELKAKPSEYKNEISDMKELISKITDKSTSIQALEERNKNAVTMALNKDRKALAEGKRSVNVAMNYYKSMNGLHAPEARFMDKKN